ncbi:DUF6151 family protein [Pseudodonghicola flavimaris]|uniref:DUF6151 family protein n=1 Tax=Pseudodonghicola flavimaris TaxID=3050036 RepID=A0ABT7EUP3_9RHOB|nr:DUF6151 family protein [Pseudodonghicola flavimaris]MDK3016069.1 DUF6151 family protein [Pseudodonghicola flavimaris]
MADGSPGPAAPDFRCRCGTLHGHLSPKGLRRGTHVACFCADCRANELAHGQPDPAPEPVGLFQLSAQEIRFDGGFDQLALMQLSPKGLYRWYARCCDTPMFNTLSSPALSFAAIRTACLDDPARLGPLRGRAFVPQAAGKPKMEGLVPVIRGFAVRALAGRLTGGWRRSPFFDAAGAPIVSPRVLSRTERAALYDR